MEILYSPHIKPSPLSRAWAGMKMVSNFQAWLGKATRHQELCKTPQCFLPISVVWGRKEEVRAVAAIECTHTPPPDLTVPLALAVALLKHISSCGAGVISTLCYTVGGLVALSLQSGMGFYLKLTFFCPTFNLSHHCWQSSPIVGIQSW